MKQRCLMPGSAGYHKYGARGIKVDPGWVNDFPAFLAYVGRKPGPEYSIERIDNDGNYEPGNVRWATRVEQCRNRRSSRLIEYAGETLTLVEWAERSGLSVGTLKARIDYRGWSMERALSAPLDPRGSS